MVLAYLVHARQYALKALARPGQRIDGGAFNAAGLRYRASAACIAAYEAGTDKHGAYTPALARLVC